MRTHGLPSTYTGAGCRCVPCTSAMTAYQRRFQQRRYERTAANGGVAPVWQHNRSTYAAWGCRCDRCREDHAAKFRGKRPSK